MQFSIVNYSEVDSLYDFRIDGEYWHPDFIQNSQLVSGEKKIRDVVDLNIDHSPHPPKFEYLEISGISLYGCEYNTVNVQIENKPDAAYHILKKGDVVVSKVRPNRNAVALIEKDGIIATSGLSVLRAKNITPQYLFAFCKTDYFIKCLMRKNKGTMYPIVSNTDVLDTPIFIASNYFSSLVEKVVNNALTYHQSAVLLYSNAQNIILSELGFTGHSAPPLQFSC